MRSGCYEVSRVGDMDTQLIRKIIRMIAFQASLDSEGQTQLRSVISARSHKLVSNTQVTMIRDEWWNLDINKTRLRKDDYP